MLTQQRDPAKSNSIKLDYLGEPWEAMRGVSAKFHWEAWPSWVWSVGNLTANANQLIINYIVYIDLCEFGGPLWARVFLIPKLFIHFRFLVTEKVIKPHGEAK